MTPPLPPLPLAHPSPPPTPPTPTPAPARTQVVATDFLLPASQQRAQGSSAPLYSTDYNVSLPGGQVARCLRGAGAAPAAEDAPVQLAAAPEGDGIYCGPLEGAPPGRVALPPQSAEEGVAAGSPSPAPAAGAVQPPPSSGGAAAAPPSPPGSGSSSSCSCRAACIVAACVAAVATAVLLA